MDEHDFRLLEVLDETKNITHAADKLYVTQSALSKRISSLEQELGAPIMLRSRQGIHFTPEGEEVLRRTREAASSLKNMRDYIDMNKGCISGTLNAGISINYALYTLPDILVLYRQKYPQVNTHIVTDQSRNIYNRLVNGQVDVAVVRGEYPWKDHKILLDREKICVICSDKYRDQPLSKVPYIGRKTDAVFEREVSQWMRENHLHPDTRGIYVDNIITCVEMVKRGLGWAIVPEICLKNFSGYSRPLVFENGEPFVRSIYLLYTETAFALPQVHAFIDIIRNN